MILHNTKGRIRTLEVYIRTFSVEETEYGFIQEQVPLRAKYKEMTANSLQQLLEYAEFFLHLCKEASFMDNFIFSDEALFYLSSHVNWPNSRILSNENP